MIKKNVVTLSIILIISVLVFALVYIISLTTDGFQKKKSEYANITLLADHQTFFSISNAINNLYIKINSNDKDYVNDIMYINLDIDKSKYLDYNFKAKEIYVISKGELYNYYIKGEKIFSSADDVSINKEYCYYILYYNLLDSKYMIEEITDNDYQKYIKSLKKVTYRSIKNNDNNHFQYVNANEENIATAYFKDYINNLFIEREQAYNCLSGNMKTKYPTYQDFSDFITNNMEYFLNMSLKKYNVDSNSYSYIDNYENEYKFFVSGIYKYTVDVDYKID